MSTAAYSLPASPAAAIAPLSIRSTLRQQLRSTVIDTVLPLGVYALARRLFGFSEVHALLTSAAQPVAVSLWSLRHRVRPNAASVLVFAGIAVNLVALALGGSAQILMLRESLLTAALGAACLASLPSRHPLIFFFVRHFQAGGDAAAATAFNQRLQQKPFLHSMRVMTAVWGVAMLAEFSLRAWMVWHCALSTVLAVSPVLLNGTIFCTIAWTAWYGKRRRARFAAQLAMAGQD